MKLAAIVGLAWGLATPTAAGEHVVFALRASEPSSHETARSLAVRRYEVREDASGRLVRVLAHAKRVRKLSGDAADAVPGKTVVQGLVGRGGSRREWTRVDIDALVQKHGNRYGVEPELIHAVIRHESNYNPFAISRKGACGLMQLMPETAARLGVKDIFDPAENVEGGVKYLRFLLDRYHGDPSLTLAAYNAGEGAVDRHQGMPPYEETMNFVSAVDRWYRSSRDSLSSESEAHGLSAVSESSIRFRQEPSGDITFEME